MLAAWPADVTLSRRTAQLGLSLALSFLVSYAAFLFGHLRIVTEPMQWVS